jgi:hypothetical protein
MQDMPAQKVDQAIKNSLAIDLWRVTSMRKRCGRVAEVRPGGGGAAGWRRRGRVAEARPGGGGAAGWRRRGRVGPTFFCGLHFLFFYLVGTPCHVLDDGCTRSILVATDRQTMSTAMLQKLTLTRRTQGTCSKWAKHIPPFSKWAKHIPPLNM